MRCGLDEVPEHSGSREAEGEKEEEEEEQDLWTETERGSLESKRRVGTTEDLSTAHHQIGIITPHKRRQTESGCYRELTASLSLVAGARDHSLTHSVWAAV